MIKIINNKTVVGLKHIEATRNAQRIQIILEINGELKTALVTSAYVEELAEKCKKGIYTNIKLMAQKTVA